ncbi:MAG TPA: hypothetical protein VLT62_14030 [Candidatus Methylomirabilis sp.]|nr:hypothetical protein [Candidatus Methylomirabilis sp.]
MQAVGSFLPESLRNLPKVWGPVADKIIQKIESTTPKYFRTARGLGDRFIDEIWDKNAKIANSIEQAVSLGGKLQTGATPAERARIDQILRGGITVNPVFKEVVEPVRRLINELQDKLLEYGYLTPEQIKSWSERFASHPEYLRRLYATQLLEPDKTDVKRVMTHTGLADVRSPALLERGEHEEVKLPLNGGKPLTGKERADFLKPWTDRGWKLLDEGYVGKGKNKVAGDTVTLFRDIPEEVRRVMGEVEVKGKTKQGMGEIRTEPGYVAAQTIAEQGRIIANHEFLLGISQNHEWAMPKETDPVLKDLQKEKLDRGGWTELPGDKKKWGPLAGMYVRTDVAKEVAESIRLRSDFDKIAGRIVGLWKYGKVIANPAAIVRNSMSSAVLADLGGLHPWMVDEYSKGLKDLLKGTGYVEEAKKVGLFRARYSQNEITQLSESMVRHDDPNIMIRTLDGLHDIVKRAGDKTHFKPAEVYGAVENFYRYNLYRYGREMGLNPTDARRYANKYAIDYEVISPFLRQLRGSSGGWGLVAGSPFATFSGKAIPLVLETLLKHPLRMLKWPLMLYGMSKLSRNILGMSEEEEQAQRHLGELSQMRYALLPTRDKDGRAQYFDLGYILPWGDLLELGDMLSGETGRRANISFMPIVGHPAFAIAEAILNRQGFTGKDIASAGDDFATDMQKRINHLAKSWGPSLMPPLPGLTTEGGFAYEDLRRAAAGETDFLGRTRSPLSSFAANMLGMRAKGVKTEELAYFKFLEMQKKLDELKSELKRSAVSLQHRPELQKEAVTKIQQRMVEIMQDYQRLFKMMPKREQPKAKPKSAADMWEDPLPVPHITKRQKDGGA